MTDEFWRDRASCRHHAPELWFPSHKATDPSRWDAPRAICATCPVRDVCLAHAFEVGEDHGMFGGLTPDERTAIRRRPRRANNPHRPLCGTEAGYNRHRRERTTACEACRDAASAARRYREAS